jgi:hypothetical protein
MTANMERVLENTLYASRWWVAVPLYPGAQCRVVPAGQAGFRLAQAEMGMANVDRMNRH